MKIKQIRILRANHYEELEKDVNKFTEKINSENVLNISTETTIIKVGTAYVFNFIATIIYLIETMGGQMKKAELRNMAISYAENHSSVNKSYSDCLLDILLGYIYKDNDKINELLKVNFRYVGYIKGVGSREKCCYHCKYSEHNFNQICRSCRKHHMDVDRDNLCELFEVRTEEEYYWII